MSDKVPENPPPKPPRGLGLLTFFSEVRREISHVMVMVPPDHETEANLPLVLLLDGTRGDFFPMIFQGNVSVVPSRLIESGEVRPMVMAFPNDNGLAADMMPEDGDSTGNWQGWLLDEVVGCVRGHYPVLGPESPVFVAGRGVGGEAALLLAAALGGRLRGVAAYLGEIQNDDAVLAKTLFEGRDQMPPILIECAEGDENLPAINRLVEELSAREVELDFSTIPGDGRWDSFHVFLADALSFFDGLMDGDSSA